MEPQAVVELLNSMDSQTASSVISAVLEARPELAPGIVSFAVPDLTYAPAKALTERRSKGVIRGMSTQHGFAFIACPELQLVFGNDVFVHSRQLGRFQVGQEVNFAVVLNKDNRPQAFDLQESSTGAGLSNVLRAQQPQALLPQLQQVGIAGPAAVGAVDGAAMPGLFGTLPSAAGSMLGPLASPPGAMMLGGGLPSTAATGPAAAMGGGFLGHAMPKASSGRKRPRPEESSILGTFEGVLKQFSASSGFGFVSSDAVRALGHQSDVFLHHSEVGACEVGSRVSFTCFRNSKGSPEAMDLQPLAAVAPPAPAPAQPQDSGMPFLDIDYLKSLPSVWLDLDAVALPAPMRRRTEASGDDYHPPAAAADARPGNF